ncbi:hypothetical protein MTO96_004585 [Rhipicephalus appendiculatus]
MIARRRGRFLLDEIRVQMVTLRQYSHSSRSGFSGASAHRSKIDDCHGRTYVSRAGVFPATHRNIKRNSSSATL